MDEHSPQVSTSFGLNTLASKTRHILCCDVLHGVGNGHGDDHSTRLVASQEPQAE
eukprot:c43563_g1_i1 orf=1-165(+)